MINLCHEILFEVFKFVNEEDIGSLRCSCKFLYNLLHRPDVISIRRQRFEKWYKFYCNVTGYLNNIQFHRRISDNFISEILFEKVQNFFEIMNCKKVPFFVKEFAKKFRIIDIFSNKRIILKIVNNSSISKISKISKKFYDFSNLISIKKVYLKDSNQKTLIKCKKSFIRNDKFFEFDFKPRRIVIVEIDEQNPVNNEFYFLINRVNHMEKSKTFNEVSKNFHLVLPGYMREFFKRDDCCFYLNDRREFFLLLNKFFTYFNLTIHCRTINEGFLIIYS